ncbi:2-hydroxycarboxylate transporter family protein [Paraburkholderia sp.]|uniref:2-hydroxycarboxylate transporter family protein n=1 Tax=Paraburkholderia sp. TaxID=1926495 RepID=UPI003D6E411A
MNSADENARAALQSARPSTPRGIERWWRVFDVRIGVLPLPVYLILIAVLAVLAAEGKLAADLPTGIALVAVGGFTCAELAKRIPFVRHIGAASIFAAFLPSALAYYGLVPEPIVKTVTAFTKSSNILYLFIAAIIVGSVLSMDRRVLVKGFAKIFVPLCAGSIAAAVVGTAVGALLGIGVKHTLFFIVIPIMAGGVGEGALPLSAGYAQILGQDQGPLFAQALSAVMLGNIAAICVAGLLNYAGEKRPAWTGRGQLAKSGDGDLAAQGPVSFEFDVSSVAAAGGTAIALYLLGVVSNRLFGWPAPVVMLLLAVIVQVGRLVSPSVQGGAQFMYRFFATSVTYPLMFAISIAMTPWGEIVTSFHWTNIVTAVATVLTITGVGFVVGRWMNMYPIEAAIVNATHSGLGGTGDVAILTAANRMELMPFAQIATRIGGAVTVLIALAVFAALR